MEYPVPMIYAMQEDVVGTHCKVHALRGVDGVDVDLLYMMGILSSLMGYGSN